jgi:hypothetical protein
MRRAPVVDLVVGRRLSQPELMRASRKAAIGWRWFPRRKIRRTACAGPMA